MKTKKTRRELELEEEIKVSKILAVCLIVLIILLSFPRFKLFRDIRSLETQLSECQEQVPEIVWKHMVISGEDFRFFIDGERFFDGDGKTISFWVQIVDKYYTLEIIASKPDYCGAILDYVLSEEQIMECYR